MRRFSDQERRARIGARHHLAAGYRGADVVAVAADLCGLHATDPISAYLAPRARIDGFEVAELELALYEKRTAIRMLGMRRTMFVLPVELAPVVHQACTAKVAAANRRRLVGLIEDDHLAPDGTRWLADTEQAVLAALVERGDALAGELSIAVPALQAKVGMAVGKPCGAEVALNNQVLTNLSAQGRIVRGRPRGRWTSTQYRWALIERWTTEALGGPSPAEAEAELARRWLGGFGPARLADLQWWAGWTLGQARGALDTAGSVEVALDDGTGWVLPDDLEPVDEPEPWIALLPALDPTAMGWTDRAWYLGPHKPALFDRSGNIGPTVWASGRVVGGWAQRPEGEIAIGLLEDVGAETGAAIETEAAALAAWLGDVRFKPKFRTPLERQLAG